MISRIQEVHMRLMATLPVRTHVRMSTSERIALDTPHGRGHALPVVLDGVAYESGAAARRKLNLSWERLQARLAQSADKRRGPNGCAEIVTLPGGEKVKRCAGCREAQPLDMFVKGSGPGGLHRHCRTCTRQWNENRKRRGHG